MMSSLKEAETVRLVKETIIDELRRQHVNGLEWGGSYDRLNPPVNWDTIAQAVVKIMKEPATADSPASKPQKMFDSWPEPPVVTIPIVIQADVMFRRVLDYDGTDSGFIEIFLPDAVKGIGTLQFPRSYFSNTINGRLPEVPDREN